MYKADPEVSLVWNKGEGAAGEVYQFTRHRHHPRSSGLYLIVLIVILKDNKTQFKGRRRAAKGYKKKKADQTGARSQDLIGVNDT